MTTTYFVQFTQTHTVAKSHRLVHHIHLNFVTNTHPAMTIQILSSSCFPSAARRFSADVAAPTQPVRAIRAYATLCAPAAPATSAPGTSAAATAAASTVANSGSGDDCRTERHVYAACEQLEPESEPTTEPEPEPAGSARRSRRLDKKPGAASKDGRVKVSWRLDRVVSFVSCVHTHLLFV